MAQITTLKDRQGQTVYPVTSSKAVFNDKGEDLEALLAAQQRKLDGQLKGYAKTEELQKKQDALSVTEDLRLTGEGLLGLTERAKQRLFDDLWREAVGVWGDIDHSHVEDDVAKPYYLNELWLTYEEAVAVYEAGPIKSLDCRRRYYNLSIRTNLPSPIRGGDWGNGGHYDASTVALCTKCPEIEVLNLSVRYGGIVIRHSPNGPAIGDCYKLRKIVGRIDLGIVNSPKASWGKQPFYNLPELVEANIYMLGASIDLSTCPKLSLASYQYCIRWGRNMTSPITITVHPDVFAKLTDPGNAEWFAVLEAAQAKNISFATV